MVVAVTLAEPTPVAVTTPRVLTATIDLLLDFHVTVCVVAVDGFTVAVNVSDAPTTNVEVFLFNETLVTATAAVNGCTHQTLLNLSMIGGIGDDA